MRVVRQFVRFEAVDGLFLAVIMLLNICGLHQDKSVLQKRKQSYRRYLFRKKTTRRRFFSRLGVQTRRQRT